LEQVTPHILTSPGSFGRVRIAKSKETGKYWAVKMLKKNEIIRLKQVDHIMNENNILASISHPFIVRP
jgi:protein kinase A